MVAFVFFFFNIRFKWPPDFLLLIKRNLLGKRKIGLAIQISLLPRWEKKCSNLDYKKPFGGHQVLFFPTLKPLNGHKVVSTVDYEGPFSNYKLFRFFFFYLETT